MTQRREIIKRINKAARAAEVEWDVLREGANHTVYTLDGLRIPIPRHRDIAEGTTEAIYKECEPKLGKDWWRQ
jgi:hypothetical protein